MSRNLIFKYHCNVKLMSIIFYYSSTHILYFCNFWNQILAPHRNQFTASNEFSQMNLNLMNLHEFTIYNLVLVYEFTASYKREHHRVSTERKVNFFFLGIEHINGVTSQSSDWLFNL